METRHLLPLDSTLHERFAAGDPDAGRKEREASHLAAVSRLFSGIVAGDYEAFAAELAEDVAVELHVPPQFPFVRRAKGRAETREMAFHNYAVLADQEPRVVSLTAQGDTVVLIGRETGRIRASGETYDLHFIYHFTLRDGKVAETHLYGVLSQWADLTP